MNALWADQQFQSSLSQGFYKVHSVYEHALNLCNDQAMITLVSKDKPKAPITCVCNLSSFSNYQLNVGMQVMSSPHTLSIGSLQVDLRNVHSDSLVDFIGCYPSLENIRLGLQSLVQWLDQHAHHEGAIAVFSSPRDVFSTHVVHILKQYLQTQELHLLPSLIGCGIGQTPSGDDVLVGMLALAYSCDHLEFIKELKHCCEPVLHQTTKVSQMMLKQAFEGQFNQWHQELILSLSRPLEVKESAEICATLGHTSGTDFMVGVAVYGLSHKKENTSCIMRHTYLKTATSTPSV